MFKKTKKNLGILFKRKSVMFLIAILVVNLSFEFGNFEKSPASYSLNNMEISLFERVYAGKMSCTYTSVIVVMHSPCENPGYSACCYWKCEQPGLGAWDGYLNGPCY